MPGISRRIRFAEAKRRQRRDVLHQRTISESRRRGFLGLALALLCLLGFVQTPPSLSLTGSGNVLADSHWLTASCAVTLLAGAAALQFRRYAPTARRGRRVRPPRPPSLTPPSPLSPATPASPSSSGVLRPPNPAPLVQAHLLGLSRRTTFVEIKPTTRATDLISSLRSRGLIADPALHPIALVFPPYSRAPLNPTANLLQVGVGHLSTLHVALRQPGGARSNPRTDLPAGEPSEARRPPPPAKRPPPCGCEEQPRQKRPKKEDALKDKQPDTPALRIGPPPRMTGNITRQLAKAHAEWLDRMVEEFYPEAVGTDEATLIPLQASLIELATKFEVEAEGHRELRRKKRSDTKVNTARTTALPTPPPKQYTIQIAPLLSLPAAPAPEWRGEESKAAVEKASKNRLEKQKRMSKLRRKHQNAERNRTRPKEIFACNPSEGFSVEGLPAASSGWMGMNMNRQDAGRKLVRMFKGGSIGRTLTGFVRVPFADNLLAQLPTLITDMLGRVVVARSRIAQWQLDLMPQFIEEAAEFVRRCEEPFTLKDMADHARGLHWFSICGHDRNNKIIPALSAFHVRNAAAIEWFFRPGSPMRLVRRGDCVAPFVEANFPGVAKRFRHGSKELKKRYGIEPQYGLFYNFCLNAARPSARVERVHCLPHTDWKNLALAVCVVFVYGNFNHREKCWLVIWEAGVVIQIPPCTFIAYPSALFYHFNIDIGDIRTVYTPDGAFPTPQNSKPLTTTQGGWASAEGRGSCVWFNQASMFQTAELGEDTLKKARAKGKSTVCDNAALLESLVFASVDSEEGIPEPTL